MMFRDGVHNIPGLGRLTPSARLVVFADAGLVEPEMKIGTIRTSIGFGFRVVLPVLGQAPLAVDFALPLTKDDEDDTQWFSFSFGILP